MKHEPKTRWPTETLSTPSPTSATTPANSLPGHEGQGSGHLIRVGDDQQVREVDRPDVDSDPDFPGAERGRIDVGDDDDLRPAVAGAQRSAHEA